ncbi:MAG: hypothetical protein U0K68_13295 [Agathobacter sp.]|nr:hypothetical protein [Agathobacter sp.]
MLGGAYFIICKLPLSFEVVAAFIVAFTVGIYFFYIGLSSALFCYLSKKGKGTYKKHNIFIMRQLASKLRTMRFTMGTISLLLCIALIGGTIAMMFAKYQDTAVNNVLPFDVIIFNQEDDYQFEEERSIVSQDSPIQKDLVYNIYHTERKNMLFR